MSGSAATALGDLVAPDHGREPVAADDQHVALLQRLPRQVHPHVGVGAERLQDDVAPLARLGFFFGQLADFDEPLRQRLVAGQLPGDVAADEVAARVPDLRDVEPVAVYARHRGRGPHPADLGMLAGVGVEEGVGALDRLPQVVGEAVLGEVRRLRARRRPCARGWPPRPSRWRSRRPRRHPCRRPPGRARRARRRCALP